MLKYGIGAVLAHIYENYTRTIAYACIAIVLQSDH